ncbi:MAG: flagellar biosynthesis protein FlhB [Mycobacterium leprae]
MYLQLFSQERTEEATPRRRQKAREEGRAARSTDLMTGAGLLAAATALKWTGASFYNLIGGSMTQALQAVAPQELTIPGLIAMFEHWALIFVQAVFPLAGVIVAVGIFLGLLQSGFLFSLRPILPDFNRINPATGFSRMFSLNTVVEAVKGLLKVAIVGYVAYRSVIGLLPTIPRLMQQSVIAGVGFIAGQAISSLQVIGLALLALGVADYGYQYWQFQQSLRMTKQEVKQEFREQEGSPELKQKQRQRAREMARRRKALKDVPTADVVITNPTHFAVALKYVPEENDAPKVIAKGADLLAQRIKVIAKEHDIPMVENRPLARALYSMVDVGKSVPPDLYQAVAEVLAFVYNLRRHARHEQA